MYTERWHARWHSQGQSGQLYAGSLSGRVSQSHPHKGTVHTHVTSAHCLPKRLTDQKAGTGIGQAHSVCHEEGGAEVTGGSLVFPQYWHFIHLISNAVTHPERSEMRLPSASEATGCGSSCLGDMEAAQEEGGKIPGLTRRVRECRQPGGIGASSLRPGHALQLLGKVPSAGQQRERPSCYRGLPLLAQH